MLAFRQMRWEDNIAPKSLLRRRRLALPMLPVKNTLDYALRLRKPRNQPRIHVSILEAND